MRRRDRTADRAADVGNGFFNDYLAPDLATLLARGAGNWQTIVSHGIPDEAWRAAIAAARPRGVARVVRLGSALDFDAVWDGIDLLAGMTRLVTLAP